MKRSKAARRSAVLNAVMVAAMVLIVAVGVLAVGSVKGWFDAPRAETAAPASAAPDIAPPEDAAATADAVVSEMTGLVNITRKGISYSLGEGTRLRDGDVIETLNAASLVITSGENRLALDENARVQVTIDESGMFGLELNNGGLFATCSKPFALVLGGEELTSDAGVFAASAPYGSAGVYMLAGEAVLGDVTVGAGELASVVSGEVAISQLKASALNAFELAAAKSAANAGHTLCFTASELGAVESERERARHDALQAQLLAEQGDSVPADGNPDYDDIAAQNPTCTIEIRCDAILDNMEKLAEGRNAYVPANGCLLAASRMSFDEGESVYDVLRRACDLAGIALEASWMPMYNSYYIEGIGNLYEFDCGEQSGWTYKVNGWFPNYGASACTLSDGDSIVFLYTCSGNGAGIE